MITNKKVILHTYTNGGYEVTIYSDGTKVREQISNDPPVTPESIDLKITNYCNLYEICKWCHEDSDRYGNHANMQKIIPILEDLPPGAELAIGGGNPLSHPSLAVFLQVLKNKGIICNLTVNQRHVSQHRSLIHHILSNNLIHGLGISVSGKDSVSWILDYTDNVVFHVIAGINTIEDILFLPKVLILGYKTKGKGMAYRDINVENNVRNWKKEIPNFLGSKPISFDNLALTQLSIKKHITPEAWKEIYMGDDAKFTYYIDAVNERFATSSTQESNFGLLNNTADMLRYVRNYSSSFSLTSELIS